jgi:hypothetical protein
MNRPISFILLSISASSPLFSQATIAAQILLHQLEMSQKSNTVSKVDQLRDVEKIRTVIGCVSSDFLE